MRALKVIISQDCTDQEVLQFGESRPRLRLNQGFVTIGFRRRRRSRPRLLPFLLEPYFLALREPKAHRRRMARILAMTLEGQKDQKAHRPGKPSTDRTAQGPTEALVQVGGEA